MISFKTVGMAVHKIEKGEFSSKIRICKLLRAFSIIFVGTMFFSNISWAQWNNTYGNEWIDYKKTYLRIGITKTGIHKIMVSSLPASFSKQDPSKYQMWHRGKEIPLLKATSTEIVFYGEMNDGASDSLVYRPASARLNPYISLFSNEGSYFLTTGDNPKRAKQQDGTKLVGQAEPYHLQKDIVTFTDQFSFTTYGFDNLLNNSFYESSNSWTGKTIVGPKDFLNNSGLALLDNNFQLLNQVKTASTPVVLDLMVNGLNAGAHDVRISLGKTISDLTEIGAIPFSGYQGKKISVKLNNLDNQVSGDGKGVLRIKSVSDNTLDWFGLTYYTLTYPQQTNMNGAAIKFFNFPASSQTMSRIEIAGTVANSEVYDVSDSEQPELIKGSQGETIFEAMVSRKAGKELKLVVVDSDKTNNITSADIHSVNLSPSFSFPAYTGIPTTRASQYDYLIVTNDKLSEASLKYAEYRSSKRGGEHRTLVANIRDIYNEFNYGEPSQIAIRRFVNYMLKDGIRPTKHNLLLIGNSVSWPSRLVKEMPDEVPTFGDPGSDMLIVEGLQGTMRDVAAIPVGRINAFTPEEVTNYLSKVDLYEHSLDTGWKKNILHLSGGHSASEVIQLKNLLSPLVPVVEKGLVGGDVQAFVRKNGSPDVETVNITPEVNNGVGMMTYFGHGSQAVTDLDMGYATDVKRDYRNFGKYPLMYFNGCGVGNIFVSRLSHTLSSDWLLANNKGAIAVVANSYRSYITSSKRHLDVLYDLIFADSENRTIGQIVNKIAEKIISSSPDAYDIANVHQSLIQGDPAMVLIRTLNPDYAVDADAGIYLYASSPDKSIGSASQIKVGVIVKNKGRYDKNQNVALNLKLNYRDGTTELFREKFSAIINTDTLRFNYLKKKDLSSVEVNIDPDNILTELDESNNQARLEVDWNIAKEQTFYPLEKIKDIISPILKVTINSRLIENNSSFTPNPFIKVVLEDDRVLQIDTTLLEVYIKPCFDETCNFQRIAYNNNVKFTSISEKSIEFAFSPESLFAGKYELLINARDNVGNSTRQPYKVRFVIIDEYNDKVEVINSPNPASSYVKFKTYIPNPNLVQTIQYIIYNTAGLIQKQGDLESEEMNEWYWIPDHSSSGLYIYKVSIKYKDGVKKEVTGKIVLAK